MANKEADYIHKQSIQKGLKNTKPNFSKAQEVEITSKQIAEDIEGKMDLVPRMEDSEIGDETKNDGILKN